MNPELKPCPFCGGEVRIEINPMLNIAMVHCDNCGLIASFRGKEKESPAAQTWNTRPDNWISVEDRLPEVDKYGDVNVLVHFNDGFINSATYDKNNGWELWQDAGEVTHWMYHPDPPKGE